MKISGLNNRMSSKQILDKWGQEAVFKIVFDEYPDLDKKYRSPFRSDKSADCRFEYENGKLTFIDNAGFAGYIKFDCFDTVKHRYGLKDFSTTCKFIEDHFKGNPQVSKPTEIVYTEKEKFRPNIVFSHQEFTDENNPFDKWFLTPKDLNRDPETFLVEKYWTTAKKDLILKEYRFGHPYFSPIVAYHFKDTKHTKLYWINRKEFKWFSNCSNEDIFNWSLLAEFVRPWIILTKSKKDALILWYVYGIPAIAVQNETCLIPDDKLKILKHKFRKIYTLFDNDRAGNEQAVKYKELYNMDNLKLPERFNDTANLVETVNNKFNAGSIIYSSIKP